MLNCGLLKRIKSSNRGSCLRWSLEQGDYDFYVDSSVNIHIFAFAALNSSDEAMQEAAYHALSVLHLDHPLSVATFVSTLVTLGAKPDVLATAGFDIKSSSVYRTKAERELLLGEWLILVERLSRYVTFLAVSFLC